MKEMKEKEVKEEKVKVRVEGSFLAITSATVSCSCRHTKPGGFSYSIATMYEANIECIGMSTGAHTGFFPPQHIIFPLIIQLEIDCRYVTWSPHWGRSN